MTKKNSAESAKTIFEPQRQSLAAILIILIKFVRIVIRQLWPVLIVVIFNRKGNSDMWIAGTVGAVSIISLIGSIIAYFKYYFFVKDGELNVRKGVLKKTSLNVPFERIQSVDFEQNIVHQLFNVVSVKIDTAGSAGNELSIDAISKETAYALRDHILQSRKQIVQEGGGDKSEFVTEVEEEKKLILSLNPMDLIKVGVSQNHLRTAALIVAFFLTIGEDLGTALEFDFFDEIEERTDEIGSQIGFLLMLIFVPVFIFISFLITLVRTVITYFNLKFWMTTNGFKVISGLITRKEKSMQKKKIQIISWSTNPLKKLFGIFRLSLFQAASTDVLGQKTMIIPGAYQHQIDETMHTIMPETKDAIFERHGIHPLARLRFIWFFGVLPCLAIVAIAYLSENTSMYYLLIYLPLSIWMGHKYYLKRGFQLHPKYLIAEGGIFGRSFKLIEIFKVQAVKITQGWYETRKNLATLRIYTAAGEINVPYVPLEKVRKLKDYILYKVESSEEEWM